MGITMFGIQGLLAPLHNLVGWMARMPRMPRARHVPFRAHPQAAHPAASRACSARATRPLRVVRVMDASHAPSGNGRMVISGRMADVCAELDRLAALEAAAG